MKELNEFQNALDNLASIVLKAIQLRDKLNSRKKTIHPLNTLSGTSFMFLYNGRQFVSPAVYELLQDDDVKDTVMKQLIEVDHDDFEKYLITKTKKKKVK